MEFHPVRPITEDTGDIVGQSTRAFANKKKHLMFSFQVPNTQGLKTRTSSSRIQHFEDRSMHHFAAVPAAALAWGSKSRIFHNSLIDSALLSIECQDGLASSVSRLCQVRPALDFLGCARIFVKNLSLKTSWCLECRALFPFREDR